MSRTPAIIPSSGGTYALLFACPKTVCRTVGRLGRVHVASGYWIYVGSAFGPGGLSSRLSHHLTPAQRPHWHLDYIKDALSPLEAWYTTDPGPREHAWAALLADARGASRPLTGFGSSDCRCRAHLIHLKRRPGFAAFSKRVHRRLALHGRLFRSLLPPVAGQAPACAVPPPSG